MNGISSYLILTALLSCFSAVYACYPFWYEAGQQVFCAMIDLIKENDQCTSITSIVRPEYSTVWSYIWEKEEVICRIFHMPDNLKKYICNCLAKEVKKLECELRAWDFVVNNTKEEKCRIKVKEQRDRVAYELTTTTTTTNATTTLKTKTTSASTTTITTTTSPTSTTHTTTPTTTTMTTTTPSRPPTTTTKTTTTATTTTMTTTTTTIPSTTFTTTPTTTINTTATPTALAAMSFNTNIAPVSTTTTMTSPTLTTPATITITASIMIIPANITHGHTAASSASTTVTFYTASPSATATATTRTTLGSTLVGPSYSTSAYGNTSDIVVTSFDKERIRAERKRLLYRTKLRLLILSVIMTTVLTIQFILIGQLRRYLREEHTNQMDMRKFAQCGETLKPQKSCVKREPGKKSFALNTDRLSFMNELKPSSKPTKIENGTVDYHKWPQNPSKATESMSKVSGSKISSAEKVSSKEYLSRNTSKEIASGESVQERHSR